LEKIIKKEEIEGDIKFDGEVIFKTHCKVKGKVRAKKIITMGQLRIDGSVETDGDLIVYNGPLLIGGFVKAGGDVEVYQGGAIIGGKMIAGRGN